MARKYFKSYRKAAEQVNRIKFAGSKRSKRGKRKKRRGLVGKIVSGLELKKQTERRRKEILRKMKGARPKSTLTVSLDNPANPYYEEGREFARRTAALAVASGTRGTLGGVYILKPINSIAAGVFKKER